MDIKEQEQHQLIQKVRVMIKMQQMGNAFFRLKLIKFEK
jgi:hypothetical protein